MAATFQTFLFMLAVLAGVAVLAKRLRMAPSILLVIAGTAIAFIPGLPRIELAPEVVLLLILPPLIYSAGVSMSWRDFRFNLRPIFLLAFGCVIFTTCAVAAAAHYILGFQWAVGFLLGAIISPTDVVAPLAIARKMGLPRRLVVVLEGEGLANDATALVLYRFAVVAVSTSTFSLSHAAGTFVLIVVGELIYGVAVGWLSLRLRHWAQEPRVEITLSLMTPFLAFWVPYELGGSGVLATVSCGLYVSWIGPRLIPSATRLQGIFFWDLLVYLIEGVVFLVTGLETRVLVEQSHNFVVAELVGATIWMTAIVIAARYVWVFPATYLPRWLSPALAKRDPSPTWRTTFFIAFTGLRGVDSLAVALAIPYTIASGAPFPHRDLILFVTFGVIVVTIIGQGLVLPTVARSLGLSKAGLNERRHEQKVEIKVRRQALGIALKRLEKIIGRKKLPKDVVEHLRIRHVSRIGQLPDDMEDGLAHRRQTAELKQDLINVERDFIYELLRDGKITDEARRRIEYELDLEEASLANRRESDGGWL